ncbi:CD99 antigen isoform X2 [Engystomops pustulosus]|uniref:CD99 antigen isoform X2 n=1 Tax=Engystomops pustulosus TaxID=76066 RepID=UPI003AFB5576
MGLPVCCCLLLLLVAGIRGQDEGGFDLSDALGPVEEKPTLKPKPTESNNVADPIDVKPKPTSKPQPGAVDDFDLEEALGGDAPKLPTLKPQPGQGGGGSDGRGFDDSDLGEAGTYPDNPGGHDGQGGHDRPHGGEGQGQEGEKQGMLAGIVSAVAVAVVGAVSSFIAYQKKKLCFKGATDDPENVNMESHKGDQSEPQVQSTLLAK